AQCGAAAELECVHVATVIRRSRAGHRPQVASTSTVRTTLIASGFSYDDDVEEPRAIAALEAWTRPRPWIADGLLAVALAALLLPASIDVVSLATWPAAARAVRTAVMVTMHACVVLRRVVPRAAFLIVCA